LECRAKRLRGGRGERWQREFWGENYRKLLKIKGKYDPEGMFVCHHCVGSE